MVGKTTVMTMPQEKFTWQVEIDPRNEDIEALHNRLRAYNRSQANPDEATGLAVFLRGEAGEMMGGITGYLWGTVLEIDFLWIDDTLRGHGVGKRLVLMLEEVARARNGRIAILGTLSFQAPDFY